MLKIQIYIRSAMMTSGFDPILTRVSEMEKKVTHTRSPGINVM